MADPITVKTAPIMIKWGKNTILDWSDDVTYYYKEEMVASGKKGNRTFAITILRSDTPDFSVSTEIGTRDKITGAINLTNGAPVEKKYLKTLTRKLKGNAEALKQLFSKYDTLSSKEETKLKDITGTKNESSIGTQVGGDVLTTALNDIKKEPYQYTYSTIDIEIKGDRRKSYGNYYYPEDLSSNKQDRVRFTQKYSEGTKIEATIDSGVKQFQRKKTKINGSVTLPIVTGIEDTNRVDWQGATLNPIQALGASGALGVFQGIAEGQGITDVFGNAAGAVRDASQKMAAGAGSDIRNAINVYLAQRAVGAQGLLSRATGAVLNPNLEMLFGGPSLRNFAFTFTLSPRDADEADQVRKIIRFFKQGMSVKTTASNVFLKAPNVFDIQYQTFNTQGQEIVHPSINIIKTCALLSCNIQYTPNNTYMTYEDPFRTMTAYQMTLAFGELDPIYDTDYKDLDENQDQVIGY